MIVRFWGVRGSYSAPLAPHDLRGKFVEIFDLIRPEDLINNRSRREFLARLPRNLFGTVGGNTSCLEVRTSDNTIIILDAGTGLKELEKNIRSRGEEIKEYNLLFTHFHYDHLMGLPFFGPLYNPSVKVNIYSPYPAMESILMRFMEKPYHPVGWNSFAADIQFRVIKKKEKLSIGGAEVDWIRRRHPNGSISYKLTQDGRSFIHSTDTELRERDFQKTDRNRAYFEGANTIVLDAQYTHEEFVAKYDWGHSSYSIGVEFAREFSIGNLYLFHHDPWNHDSKMEKILDTARDLNRSFRDKYRKPLHVEIAREGDQFEV